LNQSKAAARTGDFEQAKRLRDESEEVSRSELESRHQRIDTEAGAQAEIQIRQQQKSIEVLCKKLTNGLVTIKGKFELAISAECEVRDARLIGEVTKQLKKITGFVPQNVDIAPYQREFENRMIDIASEYGIPAPKNSRKSAAAAIMASSRSPRASKHIRI
jgi:hypothetical protein